MTRLELIAALEQAEGPSRELDREIAVASGWTEHDSYGYDRPMLRPPSESHRLYRDAPPFTDSIDAALSLVPDEWIWSVSSSGCVWVMPADDLDGQIVVSGVTYPAISICIAALKAMEDKP